MFRCGPALLVLWTILLSASPAQAQWFSTFWHGVHRDTARNRMWPEPFLKGDRDAAITPFAIQVSNGVRRQNLMSDYHFNEDNPQLNQAGETKLRFIVTQMPPNRRTIYVQRGLTPEATAMRIEMVQRTLGKMPGGGMAEVVESDLPNDGWPADEIDAMQRKFRSTSPDPRLKNASSNSGGGSSSSGGSGQ